MRLKTDSGEALLQTSLASDFWTVHSDRASVPSLAACLTKVPPEWIEDLGRWSKSMSATYVRTHLSRVRSIQRWVASAARTGEHIDEEELWSDFAVFLMKHGAGTEEAVEQIVRLAKVLASARAKIATTSAAVAVASEGSSEPLVVSATADEDDIIPSPLTPVYSAPGDKPAMSDFIVSLRRGFRRRSGAIDCQDQS